MNDAEGFEEELLDFCFNEVVYSKQKVNPIQYTSNKRWTQDDDDDDE